MIRVREVSVIDDDGESLGTLPTEEALSMAQDRDLDLVEVAPDLDPPVCRILDYGKFLYQAEDVENVIGISHYSRVFLEIEKAQVAVIILPGFLEKFFALFPLQGKLFFLVVFFFRFL